MPPTSEPDSSDSEGPVCDHMNYDPKRDSLLDSLHDLSYKLFNEMLQDFIETYGGKIDPYILEDRDIFNKSIFFPEICVQMKVLNTYITGLRTLHIIKILEKDDVDWRPLVQKDEMIHVDLTIGAGILKFRQTLGFGFLMFWKYISMLLLIHFIALDIKFVVDANSRKGYLDSVGIRHLNGKSLKVTGIAFPFDYCINLLSKILFSLMDKQFKENLERHLFNIIQAAIETYEFPVERFQKILSQFPGKCCIL